jgi:hypothetical protein
MGHTALAGDWPKNTARILLADIFGLVDDAVGFREREGRDLDIELLVILVGHLVGAVHGPERSCEGTARRVLKISARRQNGLIANDTGALDFFHFSHAVGDDPMAADELDRVAAFVRDADRVEKKPQILIRSGAARVILRMDADADVFGCGFGGRHLFGDSMIAHATVFAHLNSVAGAADAVPGNPA